MKRSALAGLFITAAMLASPAFAAGEKDLCEINLDKINNGKALLATDTSGKSGEIDTAVAQAKAASAAGDHKKCIEITSKALQDLQNSDKGGQ
ncbi:hypothetical protein C4J95_4568 [Pseudomonas orientalis]|uniref:hypothetical protein n=1 Tax=Pseudomonas orientalis TaxID=76758 RepID=UPI000F56E1CA|nr:hypothetical protein [Pseudomonas orientalis]AZE96615.1 hypothetical protein C4J96_4537 [Pseudomonas orientalis]AZF01992.1 hypothetical protein C4J95_4568 [Pseudomonas orientalis]